MAVIHFHLKGFLSQGCKKAVHITAVNRNITICIFVIKVTDLLSPVLVFHLQHKEFRQSSACPGKSLRRMVKFQLFSIGNPFSPAQGVCKGCNIFQHIFSFVPDFKFHMNLSVGHRQPRFQFYGSVHFHLAVYQTLFFFILVQQPGQSVAAAAARHNSSAGRGGCQYVPAVPVLNILQQNCRTVFADSFIIVKGRTGTGNMGNFRLFFIHTGHHLILADTAALNSGLNSHQFPALAVLPFTADGFHIAGP